MTTEEITNQINKPEIVGFFRCDGFDHLVRFVTNVPPNKYGQLYCVYQDGFRVLGGYMFAGDPAAWLPIESASNTRSAGLGKSEADELAACRMFIDANMANIDPVPHVVPE